VTGCQLKLALNSNGERLVFDLNNLEVAFPKPAEAPVMKIVFCIFLMFKFYNAKMAQKTMACFREKLTSIRTFIGLKYRSKLCTFSASTLVSKKFKPQMA